MKHHIRAIRPTQWTKSLLVLAAPVAAGLPVSADLVVSLVGTVLAFVAASSAIYLINDLRDQESDRLHPEKRFRPLASGSITPTSVKLMATGALVLAMLSLGLADGKIYLPLLTYLGLNAAYSFGAKNIPVLELLIVASGFILRLAAGSMASGVPVSIWLFICVGCGALMVVTGKRLAEKSNGAVSTRGVLGTYQLSHLKSTVGILGFTLVSSYLGWFLWGVETVTDVQLMLRLCSLLAVAVIVSRYVLVSSRSIAESPELLVVRDKILFATALWWFVSFVGANLVV